MEIEHADVLHAIVEVEANKLLHDGPDATLGEYLARRSNWAGRHPGAAYAILASYATAMKSLGIDFASLRQPSDVSPMLLPERNVIVRGKLAIVSFPVSSAISRALEKAIPAQHLQFRPRTRDWRITLTQHSAAGLAEFAAEHDFDFGTDLVAACRYYADQSRVLAPKSSATASDFETAPLRLSLYPFQRAGVEYAVRTGRCLIGDEPGLGKTAQAIAAAETLQARPVVVVVPPVVLLNWRREITRWVDGVRTVIVTNRPGTHDVVDTDTGLPPAAADYWIVAYTVLAKPAKRTTKSGREVDDFPVADFIRKRLQRIDRLAGFDVCLRRVRRQ